MRVLVWISILAYTALLWAAVAMVRHVQQARRRQHQALQADANLESKGKP